MIAKKWYVIGAPWDRAGAGAAIRQLPRRCGYFLGAGMTQPSRWNQIVHGSHAGSDESPWHASWQRRQLNTATLDPTSPQVST